MNSKGSEDEAAAVGHIFEKGAEWLNKTVEAKESEL